MRAWPGIRCRRLRVPLGLLRGYLGSDLPKYNTKRPVIDCPFTGERLAAVPAIRPDVAIVHAQKADRHGNVLMWGVTGVQKEAVLAGQARGDRHVERIVDRLDPPRARRTRVVLPHWVSRRVRGERRRVPFVCLGYYPRDNAFYKQWDPIARDRDTFNAWVDRHIRGTKDFAEFKRSLEETGAAQNV